MSTKKILIIGAGFLQTFAIKKAKELGYYVLAVDGNPQADGFAYADQYLCLDIKNEKACLEYAESNQVDGVMTAATDFGVLTASYIAQKLGLPGLNYESAELVKNKYLVRKCFYENKVDDTGESYEVHEGTDIDKLSAIISYPVMVKPCDGSGSRGASRVESAAELSAACEFAINSSVSNRAEIERFIEGDEYGVESLIVNGTIHVMAVMKKLMTNPPYYAELGHAIPSGLPEKTEHYIKRCVEKAIKTLKINFGAVNMDLLVTEKGKVHIVDVGARMGGNLIGSHIVVLGSGTDYLANLIRATVNDPVDFSAVVSPKCVATRLLALTPGKIQKLPNISHIEKEFGVEVQHHMHVDDYIQEYHTNLDGMGYVVATADSVLEAERKAEAAKQKIDKEIMRG